MSALGQKQTCAVQRGSSVMMRRMLGAPLGGTTVGGQYGLESLASMLIVPPNGAGGGGRYLPSIVVVALGEPGTPVVCWADTGTMASTNAASAVEVKTAVFILPNSRM